PLIVLVPGRDGGLPYTTSSPSGLTRGSARSPRVQRKCRSASSAYKIPSAVFRRADREANCRDNRASPCPSPLLLLPFWCISYNANLHRPPRWLKTSKKARSACNWAAPSVKTQRHHG